MRRVDLHTHTSCSDGSLAPRELLALAREAGIEMLSITDHDLVSAYAALPASLPLQLVPGIELSAHWRNRAVHIVGLDIHIRCPELGRLIAAQKSARRERMEKIAGRLQKRDLHIDLEALIERHGDQMLGRPQLADYLVQTGQVESTQKAFQRYLGQGKAGDVHSSWPELNKVVDTIARSGGVAVLAHPLKYGLTRWRLHELVADFVGFGGRALEVRCGRQIPSDTRAMLELCRKFSLNASLGSDFHRPEHPGSPLGVDVDLPVDVPPVWELFGT